MTSYPIGRCCLGPDCQYDTHELRPSHTCSRCNSVLHVLCSEFNENDDTIHCKIDCRKPRSITAVPKSGKNTFETIVSPKKKKVGGSTPNCKHCGGTNHSRITSQLCKFYKGRKATKNSSVPSPSPSVPPSVPPMPSLFCQPCKEDPVDKVVASVLDDMISKVEKKFGFSVSDWKEVFESGTDEVGRPGSDLKPKFIAVGDKDVLKGYKPVVDVDSSSFKFYKTIFKILKKDYRGRHSSILPTCDVLLDKYFPLSLMQKIANHSNAYVQECKRRDPNLDIWNRKTDSRQFTAGCIYQFIAIIYYMGIVQLPSKDDYWSTDPMMPSHDLCNQCGMSRNRFRFLWRYFHCNHPLEDDFEGNDVEGEDTFVEQVMERVLADQEEEEEDDDTHDSDGRTLQDDELQKKNKNVSLWFDKLEPFISHFREVSESMIHTLGTNLSLDETMIRFMGRSSQTHRIKNKPISEGYKFFVLATSNGFVVNFTPDGRSAGKKDGQEYEKDKNTGKIESMINHVVSIIDRLRKTQKKRVKKNYKKVSTRNNDVPTFEGEESQEKFVIAMDNYFTLPKVMSSLRKNNIGVVGTARFRRNWPPKVLKDIKVDEVNFNDFYWTVDEHGTLLGRWMDNGLVFVVSTVHKVGRIVKRLRKKPRKTNKNWKHVDEVWGDNGAVEIFIPLLIDNYNHWMGGVDLTDQRIAYYHPDLRCLRNWIPMFIQVLSMIRNNCYVIHYECLQKDADTHKQFALNMIKGLMTKAINAYVKNLWKNNDEQVTTPNTFIPDGISVSNLSGMSTITNEIMTPDKDSKSNASKQSKHSSKSRQSSRISLQKRMKHSTTQTSSSQTIQSKRKTLSALSALPPRPEKRYKIQNQAASLSNYDHLRLRPPISSHVRVNMNDIAKEEDGNGGKKGTKTKAARKRCVYCSVLFHQMKGEDGLVVRANGEKVNWDGFVRRVVFTCSVCKVYLCGEHFDAFHRTKPGSIGGSKEE